MFYFLLSYVLIRQLDKSLRSERTEILQYAKEHNELPEIVNTNEQQIQFKPTSAQLSQSIYATTKVWNDREKENEWVRSLSFNVTVGGKNYTSTVTKSQMEAEELLKLIIAIAAIIVGVIITANFIINKIVLRKLWQPFYDTIDNISYFQLSKRQILKLPTTHIDEFNLLNNSFNTMTKTVAHEYETLKKFTGNAAHEMQTPLAVIASITDALMQDEQVLKNHHQNITVIEQSVSKLSRLNQSLLLLAKIENQRFSLTETVAWNTLITQKIHELHELITSQKIQLTTDLEPIITQFHHHLADIIISNLVNNAIRYNILNGTIFIGLKNYQLTITNTSDIPDLGSDKIGNRFYRHPTTKLDGNGLGLSIVKQICEVADYRFNYSFTNNIHNITIAFK